MASPGGIVIAHLKSIFEVEAQGSDKLEQDLKKINQGFDSTSVSKFTSKINELTNEWQALRTASSGSVGTVKTQLESQASYQAASIQNLISQASKIAELGNSNWIKKYLAGGAGVLAGVGTAIASQNPYAGLAVAGTGLTAASAIGDTGKRLVESRAKALDDAIKAVSTKYVGSHPIAQSKAIDDAIANSIKSANIASTNKLSNIQGLPSTAQLEAQVNAVNQLVSAYALINGHVRDIRVGMFTSQRSVSAMLTNANDLRTAFKNAADETVRLAAASNLVNGPSGRTRLTDEARKVRADAQIEAEKLAASLAAERAAMVASAEATLAKVRADNLNAQAAREAATAETLKATRTTAGTESTTRAKKSTEDYTAATERAMRSSTGWTSAANGMTIKLGSVASQAQQAATRMNSMADSMIGLFGRMGAASAIATGPVASLLGHMWAISYASESVGKKTMLAVFGVSSLARVIHSVSNAAIEFYKKTEYVQVAMNSIFNDGGKSFKDYLDMTYKYGYSVDALSKPYLKFKIASEEAVGGGENFKKMNEDVAASLHIIGASTSDISGTYRALEQMFSKGAVLGEEFSRQLADHMPAATKVGLLAFRKMTDDAKATMEDFFSAMKHRQIDPAKFVPILASELNKMLGGSTSGLDTFAAASTRANTSWNLMSTSLANSVGLMNIMKATMNNMSYVMSGVAAHSTAVVASLAIGAGVIAGWVLLATRMNTVSSVLGIIATRISPVVLGLTAIATLFALTSSKAKGEDMAKSFETALSDSSRALDEFKKKGDTASTVLMQRANTTLVAQISKLEEERAELNSVISKLDADQKSYLSTAAQQLGTNIGNSATSASVLERARKLSIIGEGVDIFNANVSSTKTKVSELDEKIVKLTERMRELSGAMTETFKTPKEQAEQTTNAIDELAAKIKEHKKYLDDLSTGGKEFADRQREITAAVSEFNKSNSSTTDRSKYLSMLNEELNLKKRIADATKGGKLQSTAERYQGIIEFGDNMISSFGLKQSNALLSATKKVDEYREALRRMGYDEETVTAKVDQLTLAFKMQSAGLDFSKMAFKPWEVMQKGMDEFSNTFSKMLVDGKLGANSFGEAVKSMARSIIADMIAMQIRALIVGPILKSLFSTNSDFFSNLFGMGGGGGGSGWMPSVTRFAYGGMIGDRMANGGSVVSQPTMIPTSSGKFAEVGEGGGPEAVLPLQRGANGVMGVQVVGGKGGGGSTTNNASVALHVYGTIGNPEVDRLRSELPGTIINVLMDARKRGIV